MVEHKCPILYSIRWDIVQVFTRHAFSAQKSPRRYLCNAFYFLSLLQRTFWFVRIVNVPLLKPGLTFSDWLAFWCWMWTYRTSILINVTRKSLAIKVIFSAFKNFAFQSSKSKSSLPVLYSLDQAFFCAHPKKLKGAKTQENGNSRKKLKLKEKIPFSGIF